MQLETRGWFSICSDSSCYCVLSLTSFSQCGCKTLPRCPYSVPEDVEHQFFPQSQPACGEAGERRNQPQGWLQELAALIPSLPWRSGAEAPSRVSGSSSVCSSLRCELGRAAFIHSGAFHRARRGLPRVYSLVQHRTVAEEKCCSLMKCFTIYFSGGKRGKK